MTTRGTRIQLRHVLRTCLVMVALWSCSLPSAHAHSDLARSVPAADATVDTSPDEIELGFSDPVQMPDGVTAVLDLDGRNHTDGPPIVDGRTVRIPIRAGEPGTRVVSWQAISDHGSAVSGSFSFHVGAPSQSAVNGAAAGDGDRTRLEVVVLARSLVAAGLLVLLGCAAAIAIAVQRRTDAAASIAIGLGAAVVALFASALGAWIAWSDHRDVSWWLIGVGIVVAALLASQAPWRRTSHGAFVASIVLATTIVLGASIARTEPLPPSAIERDVSLGEGGRARVGIEPAVAGFTDITVTMLDEPDGGELPIEARVRYRPTDDRIAPFRIDLAPDGAGRFIARDALVPFGGRWEFEVGVSFDRFSAGLATFEADVREDEDAAS